MIVAMKKIYIVLEDAGAQAGLSALGGLGAVHLTHQTLPQGERIEHLRQEVERLGEVVTRLSQVKDPAPQEACRHWEEVFAQVLNAMRRLRELDDSIHDLASRIHQWEPWGDFDVHEIEALRKQGIHIELYALPQTALSEIPDGVAVERIFEGEGIVRLVAVSRGEFSLPGQRIDLPRIGLGQMRVLLENDAREKAQIERFIAESARYRDALRDGERVLHARLAYQEALAGRGRADELAVIEGFCPADRAAQLEALARDEQWALLIEDPRDDDEVPTLVRNPRWVEVVEPVMSMIDILPGYRETDISAIFLIFFSIFFGILIGDAGYGAVLGLGTLWAQMKAGKRIGNPAVFILMYLLAGATVVWGALTGTFFGQKWLIGIFPPLSPWLTESANVQRVCFLLGALQLSLAHFWRAALYFPSIQAVGQIGWGAWIWGMFFLVRQLILSEVMPGWAPALMIGGAAGIVLGSGWDRNPFKMIARGVAEFFGGCVNSFTDVISYIRLFAVGMASVAIADAFNEIALGIGFGNVFAGLVTVVILVIGHALDMVLGGMSILVHGVRLNVLEFSNHMNIQWTGVRYAPFVQEKKGRVRG